MLSSAVMKPENAPLKGTPGGPITHDIKQPKMQKLVVFQGCFMYTTIDVSLNPWILQWEDSQKVTGSLNACILYSSPSVTGNFQSHTLVL